MSEYKCPECGTDMFKEFNDTGLFLIGVKTRTCPGCGQEITATARL